MSLCQYSEDIKLQLPCELGVAEFSINGGIINTMHRFIHPGGYGKILQIKVNNNDNLLFVIVAG
jgi:hypothetical protein